MAKNPLLQKKYEEGFKDGLEKGQMQGIEKSVMFFFSKLEELEKMPGIGVKTMEKVKQAVGDKYFL